MARKLTIRDISRLTGYSRSTVSLVLNESPKVGKQTREKILGVIRELDYYPSAQARGLASRRSTTIAVVVPPIQHHLFSDYYYSEALGGIAEIAAESGYDLLLQIAMPHFIEARKYCSLFKTGVVAGMVFIGASENDTYIQQLDAEGFPVMMVNGRNGAVPAVLADNVKGAREGVRYLIRLGHRRIACIDAPQNVTTSRDRLAGYWTAMEEAGISVDQASLRTGDWTDESGCEAAKELLALERPPTAIFAVNDMMAVGVLRAARERKLEVPRDLSVLGADDIRLVSYVRPALTTIRQPIYPIARLAMASLIGALERGQRPVSQIVPTELVIRDSCAPPAEQEQTTPTM